jgi:hypothetical protein
MGGHAYWYFVPYEHDVQAALDKLRAREFAAGRYSPAIRYLEFEEPEFTSQRPERRYSSIEAAIDACAEEGTRSILDIDRIGKTLGFGVAAPLPAKRLTELYDTDRPTHAMVDNHEFFDDIPRGQCVYVIVYVDDKPSELFFAGYSYD